MSAEFLESVRQNEGVSTEVAAAVLGTSVTGMLLVAFVDGTLHWHERETLVESVRAIGDHVSPEQLLKYLDETAHMLGDIPQSHWPGLFDIGRSLPDNLKITVLAMITKVAFADGHLTADESSLIHQIADWIDLDEPNRKIWKREVRGALAAAETRGLKYTGIENLELSGEVTVQTEDESSTPYEDEAATPYVMATRAYVAGEMKKCVQLLEAAAADDDAQSQALLGTLYQEGDAGLQQDTVHALKLFEQAASQHNLMGTFLLARTHYLGIGVNKDERQGVRLFKRAAFMNFPDAQAMLADIYRAPKNGFVGGAWLLVAAYNGHKEAVKYVEQQGEPPDDVKDLATRLIGAIQNLQLLVHMNPDAALARLAEMENEEI